MSFLICTAVCLLAAFLPYATGLAKNRRLSNARTDRNRRLGLRDRLLNGDIVSS